MEGCNKKEAIKNLTSLKIVVIIIVCALKDDDGDEFGSFYTVKTT